MQNQAPGYFHFNILRGLYWKMVPFLHRWIQPMISTRRSRYGRINLDALFILYKNFVQSSRHPLNAHQFF